MKLIHLCVGVIQIHSHATPHDLRNFFTALQSLMEWLWDGCDSGTETLRMRSLTISSGLAGVTSPGASPGQSLTICVGAGQGSGVGAGGSAAMVSDEIIAIIPRRVERNNERRLRWGVRIR